MTRFVTMHAIFAALLACYATADVAAQIRFSGDNIGLSVNGKRIDTGNLHESLLNVVEILGTMRDDFEFNIVADGPFPMRARINGAAYEIWRDRITESCDGSKAVYKIQIGSDPVVSFWSVRRRNKASGHQINTPFLVNSFKGDQQQTDLFVNYGVPLEPIYDNAGRLTLKNANISTFLFNDRGDILIERTRSFDYSINQVEVFPDQDLWVDTQQFEVSPDTHDQMVVQIADGRTAGIRHREINVPDYDREGLMLSDIMLAYSVEQTENDVPSSANEIVRNGFAILPAPRNLYSTEWPIYLYFEVYGLAPNARGRTEYDVEITLEPENADRRVRRLFRRKGGKEGVSVSYRGNGSEPEASLYQILDVSDQKTGLYTLTLSVRDNETGEESVRIRDLFLQRWGLSCSERRG